MTEPDLIIVVPVFDEAESPPRLHEEITAALTPAGLAFEGLYVDDGSTDEGPRVLRGLADSDPQVRIIPADRGSNPAAPTS
jgi:glycosyltransferase involved in cell wall biosynthesis